eukprot:Opistho-2@76940
MLAVTRARTLSRVLCSRGCTAIRKYATSDKSGEQPPSTRRRPAPVDEFGTADVNTTNSLLQLLSDSKAAQSQTQPKYVSSEELKSKLSLDSMLFSPKHKTSILDKADRKRISFDAEPLGIFKKGAGLVSAIPASDITPSESASGAESAAADEFGDLNNDGDENDLNNMQNEIEVASRLRAFLDFSMRALAEENTPQVFPGRENVLGDTVPEGEESFEDHMKIGAFIGELGLPDGPERNMLERVRHILMFHPGYSLKEKEMVLEKLAVQLLDV